MGKRASLAAQTIETKPSGGDLALFPKRVGCVVRTGICGPEEHHGLELSLWMGGVLGLRWTGRGESEGFEGAEGTG